MSGTHRLGPVAAIPLGEGRAFAVDDRQIVVFRPRGGGLRAMAATCPHAGGPLADAQIDDVSVVCPLHSHVFALADGRCATADLSVPVYPAREEDGAVVVEIG